MSHGWDIRTMIETAVSHRWARRIQREPPLPAAARNVLSYSFSFVLLNVVEQNVGYIKYSMRGIGINI